MWTTGCDFNPEHINLWSRLIADEARKCLVSNCNIYQHRRAHIKVRRRLFPVTRLGVTNEGASIRREYMLGHSR